jgi:serine/threonine-protein kinase PknK
VNVRPVSRTKVTPAPVGEAVLARDRLLDWLHRHVHRRIVTVVAETGYGKTTLLADFTRRTAVRCLWYRIDGSDRDWITFVHYIVAAAREAVPSFGGATLALFREEPPGPALELVVSTLLAELAELSDQTTVLILDDWQVVDEEQARRRPVAVRIVSAGDEDDVAATEDVEPTVSNLRFAAMPAGA